MYVYDTTGLLFTQLDASKIRHNCILDIYSPYIGITPVYTLYMNLWLELNNWTL
jgi:hypothetical protein